VYIHWSVYIRRMPRPSEPTRERIIQAASALFYNEGIRRVSVDEVAAKAGLTKRRCIITSGARTISSPPISPRAISPTWRCSGNGSRKPTAAYP